MFVSVIVPVYNVEKYLNRCVSSILAQTYKEFELVLVDDGSTDNCPQICDEYEKHNKGIVRTVHKSNGGLSDARNSGVINATGNYVTFIDSDDWINENYLENLVSLINKYRADISVTGIEKCTKNRVNCKEGKGDFCVNGELALKNMLYQKNIDTSACAILLPRNMAMEYPFPKGKFHEDEFTTYNYYFNSRKVAISLRKQYYYFQRKGSIMHEFGKACMDELDAADNLVEWSEKKCKTVINAAKAKKYSDYCQILGNYKNEIQNSPDIYKRIMTYLTKERKLIIFDHETRLKNKIAAISLCYPEIFFAINRLYKLIK